MSVTVNGVKRSVTADPDTPFLYVLRNDLGLKGTLFGCGTGLCGACLVLIDGNATPSCDTPLWAVAGKEVVTVEGLQREEALSELQQAFVDDQAGQCGYCLAGILISATAIARTSPPPSHEEALAALDRNLCRCGSHPRIIEAVMRVLEAP